MGRLLRKTLTSLHFTSRMHQNVIKYIRYNIRELSRKKNLYDSHGKYLINRLIYYVMVSDYDSNTYNLILK